MAKVKKEPKIVKSPIVKIKKINTKSSKKNALKRKSKLKKKLITKSIDKDNLANGLVNKLPLNLDINQVQKGVEALLQYSDKYKSKNLFKGQQQIFVQITCVRIPTGANRKFRIKLRHPLITIDNEICLIVPDLKRGRNIDHEPTIEHYENLLKSKNVTYIKRIIPIRQIRVEYDQFELKRRLCGYYDYFLVDGRISGHVLHLLGKTFTEKRKQPVPIQLNSEDLNNTILKAMSKTELNVHSKGDTYIAQIGHTEMSVEHIVDNLQVIINSIVTSFPGNWKNIRALHVKTEKSIAIPIYYTFKNSNEVVPPKVKVPKMNEIITDEISTRKHTVTIYPDGNVVLNEPITKNKAKLKAELKSKKNAKILAKKTQNAKIKRRKAKNNKVKSLIGKKSPIKAKPEVNGKVKQSPKKNTKTKVKAEAKSPATKIKTETKVEAKAKSPAKKIKKEPVSPKRIKIEKQH